MLLENMEKVACESAFSEHVSHIETYHYVIKVDQLISAI